MPVNCTVRRELATSSIAKKMFTSPQMGEEILERVIQMASGETKTKAELLAQNDFIPWRRGVSL